MPKKNNPFGPWYGLGFDMWMLGAEASSVIALRTLKLAAGGAAADEEARLMLGEKLDAAMLLSQRAMMGQLGATMPGIAAKTIADYRRRVRRNQRRLTRRYS